MRLLSRATTLPVHQGARDRKDGTPYTSIPLGIIPLHIIHSPTLWKRGSSTTPEQRCNSTHDTEGETEAKDDGGIPIQAHTSTLPKASCIL